MFENRGEKSGTPEGSRTPNLLIRSQVLYPIELRVHNGQSIYRCWELFASVISQSIWGLMARGSGKFETRL
jgi:hypothetical protein